MVEERQKGGDAPRTDPLDADSNRTSVAGQILIFATQLDLIGLVVNGLVTFTACRIGQAFAARNHFSRVPQFLLGSVFAGLAIRLALAERR
jgi:threonine/homoserine/homoserine lactone efflux protein